jgi:hypothetical protein
MNLPDNLLQNLETDEDLNNAMAEAQVLLAVTSGPIAANNSKMAGEATVEVTTAESSGDGAAIEAINALDYPDAIIITNIETKTPTDAEADNGAGDAVDVAVVRSEKRATILQELIKNQAASLEDYRVAHPSNAEVAPETEYPVDHNFVETLHVVLQECRGGE